MFIMLHNMNKPINFVLSGINKKAALPVLRGVRVRQKGDKVTLTSTNLEIESSVEIFNDEPGDDLDVVIMAGRLTADSFKQRCLLAFPDEPRPIEMESHFPTMRGKGKRKGASAINGVFPFIKKAVNFCSKDELKSLLQGVHLFIKDRRLYVESTNGHIAYRNYQGSAKSTKEGFDIVISNGAIRQLMKMKKVFKTLSFEYNEKYLYVTGEYCKHSKQIKGKLIIKLMVDGKFPQIDNAIPVDLNHKVCDVNTKEALEFIKEMKGTVLKQEGFDLDTTVEFSGHGEAKIGESVYKCFPSMNIPIRVGFNVDYLLKIFKNMGSDVFHWEFMNPMSASLLYPVVNEEKVDELFLLMPIRLAD